MTAGRATGSSSACAMRAHLHSRRDVRAADPPVRAPAGRVPPLGPEDASDVARDVTRLVESARPGTDAQHVGSSSVPGMPGKNVVDLGVEADPTTIPDIVDALLSLGFQRQGGTRPVPPDATADPGQRRPRRRRRTGSISTSCRRRVTSSPSSSRFRDALRTDPTLRDGYAASKRAFVETGARRRRRTSCTRSTRATSSRTRSTASASAGRRPTRRYPLRARRHDRDPGRRAARPDARRSRRARWATGSSPWTRTRTCPTAAVADEIVVGAYDDADAARRLARMSDVVTYELEHVGLDAAAAAGEVAPLRPGLASLRATRDRLAERRFIRRDRGVGRRRGARSATSTTRGRRGCPRLPAPPQGGRSAATTAAARCGSRARRRSRQPCVRWAARPERPLLMEAEIDFEAELSVVVRPRPRRSIAQLPGLPERPRRRDPRRERARRPRCIRSSPRMPARSRTASPRPRPRRPAHRRAVPAAATAR